MPSSTTIRKVFSFTFWALTLVFAVFLPKLYKYQWWSIVVGTLPFIVRLAYEHFDNINLLANRAFLWALNKEVAWEMKARFVGEFSKVDLDDVFKVLHERLPSMNLLQRSNGEITINIPDIGVVFKMFVVNVQVESSEAKTELVLAVQRIFVPFRHSTTILNELVSLVNYVRTNCEFESESYDFTAVFTASNPYLGLFLRRLKVAASSRLNVEYRESEGANQVRVAVTKDKVVLVTHDLQSLQAFSKKYITLSSLNLSAT